MNCGIYKITNTINQKCYIGSSSAVKERLLKHQWMLRNNKHHSIKLQRGVNKYGLENFTFELLELCEVKDLLIREQFFIDNFSPFYNVVLIAGSTRGHKKSLKSRLQNGLKHKGKIISEYTRELIRKNNIGRKHTEEAKAKISEVQTGRYYTKGKHLKAVYMLDNEENILKEFITIREASRQTGANRVSIGNVCAGRAISAGGFKWRFVND